MNEYLIVRISNQVDEPVSWWIWDESTQQKKEVGILPSWENLGDLKEQGRARKTILLLNSSDVLIKQITQPKGSGRHFSKMLPFLIEEDVAQDIDTLHLSVLEKQGDQVVIAGVDKQWFTQFFSLCQAAQLQLSKIVPDALTLPDMEQSVMMAWGDQWLVKEKRAIAHCLSANWLTTLMPSLWAGETGVTQLLPAGGERLSGEYFHHQEIDSVESLVSQGAIQSRFTLMTGSFKAHDRSKAHWLTWRPVLFSSLLLLTIYCAQTAVSVHQSNLESSALRTESERIFRSVFTDKQRIPTVSYLKRQFTDEIARLSGGAQSNDFFERLDRLTATLDKVKGVQLNRMNFDESRREIRVDLQGESFQQFEQVKGLLSDGFSVQSGPINRSGELVSGSYTLTWSE